MIYVRWVDAEQLIRQKWRLLKRTLDERGRRRARPGADAIGFGGVAEAARATGLAIKHREKGPGRGSGRGAA